MSCRWKVENALELLDAPEEWFFNAKTRELFLWHNATDGDTSPGDGNLTWVVPVLKTLVDVRGTAADPVRGVTISGVGFRDSPYTYVISTTPFAGCIPRTFLC